jgi:ATP-dependent DNA helicase RecG
MSATAFASPRPLEPHELESAPVHYPRVSRLAERLSLEGTRAQRAAVTLGLETVGDLLEHLPRDRREARAVAQLTPGETATVVVQVRQIASRSVRRRGMRPLVEATVGDDTGSMKVAFFNQPWLVQRYPAGTRLVLHGKYEARNRFSVQAHARTAEAATGAEAVAHYPATEGLSSTQILALVSGHTDAFADVLEPLSAALRTFERLPDRPAALLSAHFAVNASGGGSDGGSVDVSQAVGYRRLAFDELLLATLALLRRRTLRRQRSAAAVLDGERDLTARWLETMLPFQLTGDQQHALEAIDGDLGEARPMQRLLMGEVGSGKTVVALYALSGGADGPDRAAGRAALRHDPVADARTGRARRAADRLDARPP